ncbi:uncharacterized protein L203_100476 [Cryptococcus depauperatus CBS 7841]|uniref:Uncharacterized protein n=1 Tax=Cryptococcus depauperatus CBS 7841 TaxID=1295531 RepID=A0AAJ8JN64_9TREE
MQARDGSVHLWLFVSCVLGSKTLILPTIHLTSGLLMLRLAPLLNSMLATFSTIKITDAAGSIAYSSTVVIQAGSSSSCVSSFRDLSSSSVASNSASNTVSSKSPNTASVS